jgi:hypothetical protein
MNVTVTRGSDSVQVFVCAELGDQLTSWSGGFIVRCRA